MGKEQPSEKGRLILAIKEAKGFDRLLSHSRGGGFNIKNMVLRRLAWAVLLIPALQSSLEAKDIEIAAEQDCVDHCMTELKASREREWLYKIVLANAFKEISYPGGGGKVPVIDSDSEKAALAMLKYLKNKWEALTPKGEK